MSEEQKFTDLEAVLHAGAALGNIREIEGTPLAIVPEGYNVEGLEHLLIAPVRSRGFADLNDEASFVAFVNLHKTEATDLYFHGAETPSFAAVFNADRKGSPGRRDFGAKYRCPLSPEWKAWRAADGAKMGQEDFARFIETNLPDIVSPEAANMLEIALSLEAKKKVNFASGLRLTNGSNQLTYEEQVDGTAAKGKLTIPEKITIGIPVFENGDRYAVEANFRYRIADGGKLTMWYELVRPHKVIDDAVKAARRSIEKATGLMAFNGSPA